MMRSRDAVTTAGSQTPIAMTSGRELCVENLRIETQLGTEIVDEVSFSVGVGEVFALVGESGCGKTSVAMALLGHAREGTRIASGSVHVNGEDILVLTPEEIRMRRGRVISYVPQDPTASLSPRMTIQAQLVEAMTIHGFSRADAIAKAHGLVERVELPKTDEFLSRYPFELSGGQQQRVLIAMALSCSPTVVVLDEPTTGLDVTTQARVLELLMGLASEERVAFVYVTHDLAVVDQLANRIGVMYSGRLVETGDQKQIFTAAEHPYTTLLLDSVPRIADPHALTGIPGTTAAPGHRPSGCFFRLRCPLASETCATTFPPAEPNAARGFVRCFHSGELQPAPRVARGSSESQTSSPLLEVRGLDASYGRGSRRNVVVKGVSFTVAMHECVALVGESGSGKTTTGRCVAGLHELDAGDVLLKGEPLPPRAAARSPEQLKAVQIVFQNPQRSLNPSHTVRRVIDRSVLRFHSKLSSAEREERIAGLVERVRLPKAVLDRYPAELSGGEKQRVAIARALASDPLLLICDEVTSALDVSIQAVIINLLDELRADGLAMLFITHNLGVVSSLADRTLVMEQGLLVENGTTRRVIREPEHTYTQQLLAAAPDLAAR